MTRLRLAATLLALVTSAACAEKGSPSEPSTLNLSGNWSGTLTDAQMGQGTITFTLTQSGPTVSGNWSTAGPGTNGGSMSGSVSGSSFTATLTSAQPQSCPLNATATIIGTDRMEGSYSAANCSMPVSGTFTVTKRLHLPPAAVQARLLPHHHALALHRREQRTLQLHA